MPANAKKKRSLAARWFKIVAGVAIALLAIYFLFLAPAPAVPVDVAIVSTGPIRTYVDEEAKTRLPNTYKVTMPLDGRILPIAVRENDPVSQGQIVARMDPADLQTELDAGVARVTQLDLLIVSTERAVEAAIERTKSSQAKFEFQEQEHKRVARLREQSAASESQLNAAELAQFEARVDHTTNILIQRSMEAMLSATRVAREEFEQQRQRKERDRNRVDLASPVDGVVLARLESNERVLRSGEVLLEIGRLAELEVEAEVLTQDAALIVVGAAVDVEGPSIGPEPARARVTRVNPRGFTKVSSLGVEQQRVVIAIEFDEGELARIESAGRKLGADYRVRVKIYTAEKESTLIVPRAALFRGEDGGWQVFVVQKDIARRADVQVGLMNDLQAEITAGLGANDAVILAPESSLENGQSVAPRAAE